MDEELSVSEACCPHGVLSEGNKSSCLVLELSWLAPGSESKDPRFQQMEIA